MYRNFNTLGAYFFKKTNNSGAESGRLLSLPSKPALLMVDVTLQYHVSLVHIHGLTGIRFMWGEFSF